jgi:hypothetical protein
MKVRIIEAVVKDDGDYDYIHDSATHNTLKQYWKWAEESGAKISFERNWGDSDYSLKLIVNAVFEDEQDYALFKIMFGHQPLNKLKINKDMEGYFIHE